MTLCESTGCSDSLPNDYKMDICSSLSCQDFFENGWCHWNWNALKGQETWDHEYGYGVMKCSNSTSGLVKDYCRASCKKCGKYLQIEKWDAVLTNSL